jgi:ABC-type dipeptide/oligopeptide/nickel transport system permease component/ABC-type transport system substrate-binding protein
MTRLLGRWLIALLILLPAPLFAHAGLVVALQLEPPNLDPTSGAAIAIDEVTYGSIFESLVRLDAQGQPKPWLAAGWTVSPDGLTYDFRLRGGVRFSDGTPFDAETAAFSLTRIAAPGSTNAQATAFAAMARAEATGPLALRVTLRRPDADFLRLLSYGDAVMVSPRSAAGLATNPVGTGPYALSSWRRGDEIVLARVPHYWGVPAREPRLSFRFIADASAAYAAVKAHDIDIFPDFPAPETLAQLRADPSLKVVIGPTEGQVILAFNQRSGPLADLRVRRAISYALDRHAIIDGAMYGYGTPIGSHFAPQDPDYLDLTGRYPHDLTAARRLLAEAGYGNGLSLSLKLPPPPYARRSGEIVAAQLAAVGIHVAIRNVEWAQWLDEVYARHAFDLTIINHAEPYDYDIYGRPDYYFGYHSAIVSGLLDRLKATADPGVRHGLLQDLQRQLADDAANGFLFEFPRLGVQDARLQDGWVNTPNEAIDLATAHLPGDAAADGTTATGGDARVAGWIGLVLLGAALVAVARWLGPAALAKRLGVLAGTLLVATALIFLLVQIAPGDPAAYMMGLDASPQAVAALHAELGLEGPPLARYLGWLGGMLHGDFGLSYTYRVPVAGLLADRLAVSLPLALLATLLSILVGVPAGYASAAGRGRAVDRWLGWAARIGIAIPSFWLAILLVLLFSATLRWFVSGGFPGWAAGVGPALSALVLPVVALGVPQAAILARVTRSALIEAMAQDYVRTARAKGASRRRALIRHALPNALGPVITILGLQVPFLLAGSAIVETVFFLPGLGRLVLQAIAQRDLIVVQAVVALMVAATIVASFAADIALVALDPRLRRAR